MMLDDYLDPETKAPRVESLSKRHTRSADSL
jgi:hypothetical protein